MIQKNKIFKFLDLMAYIITSILIVCIAIGMIAGGFRLILDLTFIKYLITLSFILAGFTFFTVIEKKINSRVYWIVQSCWCFLLSGFFFLAYLTISNIGETDNIFLKVLLDFNTPFPLFSVIGLISLVLGITTLILILNGIVNNLPSLPPKKN